MSFVEPLFFFFMVPVLGALVFSAGRARLALLVCAAYVFYAAANPVYLLILIGGTLFDYFAGARIHRAAGLVRRRAWMVATVASNLGLLVVFKYAGFLAENINRLCASLGFDLGLAVPAIALPLGISFFTFQSLSYTLDIYRGTLKPAGSLLEFACFISFFPHLVAGPIIRARDFFPQLGTLAPLTRDHTWMGLGLMLVGYFKKCVVGDNAGVLVDAVFSDPGSWGGAAHALAAMFFAIQIYADFSGYSDIATGLSLLIGIRLKENFHWPYLSESIREFWRRWHMSLSFFLRDYLYFALGGDRGARLRTTINLIVVWFLGGLWHGAAWHFVAWGLYHGTLVSTGRQMFATRAGRAIWQGLGLPLRVAVTFVLVCIGWIFFRAATLDAACAMIAAIFAPWRDGWTRGVEHFTGMPLLLAGLALAVHVFTYNAYRDVPMRTPLLALPAWGRPLALALAAAVIVLLAGNPRRFIYFDF